MKLTNLICIVAGLLLFSCEIEKTEYRKFLTDKDYDMGFGTGMFIVHKQSISFYSPGQNKVFSDIYYNQNGVQILNPIHSFVSNGFIGVISFENDNTLEWIRLKNFTTIATLSINGPKNITSNNLLSYGGKDSAGVCLVDYDKTIIKNIPLNIDPGKIFGTNGFIYVFSSGNNMNDSIIYRLYTPDSYHLNMIHKLDSFVVGKRPIDCVNVMIEYSGYFHPGLYILCKGNSKIPPSIVEFDLVTNKVVRTHYFESTDYKPENLFWILPYTENTKLVSYINNKLYIINLENGIALSLLTNKNVSELVGYNNYYIGVSRDTTSSTSYLYRFKIPTFEIADSLVIDGKALNIIGDYYE
ncbi:MAG TPA: hypothetical protein VK179_05550 [Bacteroidales bacterium]|nr:hypothetical protein [Bacteroidales bacterium]